MPITSISSRGTTTPYITLAELKRSPIYNQLQQLTPNASPTDRDAELGRIIARVSSMINSEVKQNLAATVDTEVGEVSVSRRGDLNIFTRCTPIAQVLSVSVGADVFTLSPITDLSHVVIAPWCITIPRAMGRLHGNDFSLAGVGRPGQRLWAEWVYVNGFPVTTLSVAAAVGDTAITVVDSTGIVPNQTQLTLEDGTRLETVAPTAVTGNVLTIPPLLFSHQVGVGAHELPGVIKEVALLLISRLHDSWSLSMGAVTHDGSGARLPEGRTMKAMCDPAWMLNPFTRKH